MIPITHDVNAAYIRNMYGFLRGRKKRNTKLTDAAVTGVQAIYIQHSYQWAAKDWKSVKYIGCSGDFILNKKRTLRAAACVHVRLHTWVKQQHKNSMLGPIFQNVP